MRTRALAVLTAALLTIGTSAGAAAAREVVLRDPPGDMWRMEFSGEREKAPDARAGDVRRAVVRHGKKNIVIGQRYVDLSRIGDYALFTVRIQNGERDRYREVRVEAGPRSWRGTVTVFDARGDRVDCDVTHRIDYRRNTLLMKVPRSCLGTPRAIRATVSNLRAHRSQQAFLVDNPHNEWSGARTWTRWVRWR